MIRKPDPRLFEIALLKAGLTADKVWYCGDSFRADVLGAREAGIFPVWYEDETVERSPSNPVRNKTEPADFPFLRSRNLRELKDILENPTQKRD